MFRSQAPSRLKKEAKKQQNQDNKDSQTSQRKSFRLAGCSPTPDKTDEPSSDVALSDAEQKFVHDLKDCQVVLERIKYKVPTNPASYELRECRVSLKRLPQEDRGSRLSPEMANQTDRGKTPDLFDEEEGQEDVNPLLSQSTIGGKDDSNDPGSPRNVLDSPEGSQGNVLRYQDNMLSASPCVP